MVTPAIHHKAIIRAAAANVGGIVSLSIKLGLSRARCTQWEKVPEEYLLKVEELTGVPREELRPDLFDRQAA